MKTTAAYVDVRGLTKPEIMVAEWTVFAGSVAQGVLAAGTFVEIGVYRALSTRCVLQVLGRLDQQRRVISIDPFRDAAMAHVDAVKETGGSCNAEFRLAMSHAVAETFDEPVAWLLVDGCHCYECVSEDLSDWIPKVSPWGVVVMHDTRVEQIDPTHNKCWRTGVPETRIVEVARAIRDSEHMRSLTLVDMVETNTKYGIRVYRRIP